MQGALLLWMMIMSDISRDEILSRFYERTEDRGMSECWPWHGSVNKQNRKPFPVIWLTGGAISARRVAWSTVWGEAPRDRYIHPRPSCREHCVNPHHMTCSTSGGSVTRGKAGRLSRNKLDLVKCMLAYGTSTDEVSRNTGVNHDVVMKIAEHMGLF